MAGRSASDPKRTFSNSDKSTEITANSPTAKNGDILSALHFGSGFLALAVDIPILPNAQQKAAHEIIDEMWILPKAKIAYTKFKRT